jgi:hypothetical protein
MTKVFYFSNFDLTSYSCDFVNFVGYEIGTPIVGYYDAVVFDKDDAVLFDANIDKFHEHIYKIAIINNENEAKELDSAFCDAWVLSDRLGSLCKLVESQKIRNLMTKKVNEDKEILSQIIADNDINARSLELIMLNLKKSTTQIKAIFEEQVGEMKHIHSEIQNVRECLKDQISPPACQDVVGAAQRTEDLLGRTDEVIKAMFGFVRILQCEDRISQMVDGIKNVLEVENDMIGKTGIQLSHEKLSELQSALVGFFTIDEQRALAHGERDLSRLVECGESGISDDDAIELF